MKSLQVLEAEDNQLLQPHSKIPHHPHQPKHEMDFMDTEWDEVEEITQNSTK